MARAVCCNEMLTFNRVDLGAKLLLCAIRSDSCTRDGAFFGPSLTPTQIRPNPNASIVMQQGVENLFERLDRMVAYGPVFCDITWGAGGSTADVTLDIATRMQNLVRRMRG